MARIRRRSSRYTGPARGPAPPAVEPAEPLAERVGHGDDVVHEPARELVAQRLAAAAVDELLRQERVLAVGRLAGERAQRADGGADPGEAPGEPGVEEGPRVDGVDDGDPAAAEQRGEPGDAVGSQAGRQRQHLDRDRALPQSLGELADLLAERAEHGPVARRIEVEREIDDPLVRPERPRVSITYSTVCAGAAPLVMLAIARTSRRG